MKESLFFFVAIIGVLAAVYLWGQPKKEGFQDGDKAPAGSSPGLTIPLISPRYQTLAEGEVQPLTPPTATLLAPPPGQTASVNSLPAEDPASQKAPTGRLESLLLSLKGFFTTDAPGLSKIGDPSIQLPMSTAKSDQARLQDEINVLQRNPGLQSTLTQQDLDGIEGNLAYLQKKWRQSTNSMSGSPMPPTEGFSDLAPTKGWFAGLLGPRSSEGFQTSSGPSGPSGPSSTTKKSDVKLKDLEDLNLKLSVEILRLQSSGTTDLTVVARINVLTDIQKAVSDLISDVRRGVKREEELPLMKADIANFLPAMSNPNANLPDLFSMGGLSDVLNSLFPKYGAGDVSGAEVAQQFFDKYGDAIFNNLSWNVGFTYKGKAEQEIAANWAAAMRDAKMAAEWSPTGKGLRGEMAGPAPSGPDAGTYGGFFQNVITNLTGGGTTVDVTVDGNPAGGNTGGGGDSKGGAKPPSRLDWKKRSTDICNQIRARGLPASEFGCFEDPDKIKQEGFSWRGYARMVCNRLSTVHDPSVPELCGCPSPTWPGWKP